MPAAGATVEHCLPASTLVPAARCAVGDMDGDRRPDFAALAKAAGDAGRVEVRLSQGGGQELDLSRWPSASGMYLRDVDGDDDRDIVITAGIRRSLAVFLNDGTGAFRLDEDERNISGASLETGADLDDGPGQPIRTAKAVQGPQDAPIVAPCKGVRQSDVVTPLCPASIRARQEQKPKHLPAIRAP